MADSTDTGGLLQGLMNNPLFYAGLGLMSGAHYGSNAGEGLLQGLGAYQQNRAASQQYQMNQLNLQRQQAMYGMLGNILGGQQGGAQTPPQPSGPPPGIAAPPASPAVPRATQQILGGGWMPQAPAAPNPYAPPSLSDIYGAGSPQTMSPQQVQAYSLLMPEYMKAAGEAATTHAAAFKQQIGPALAELGGLVKGDTPISYIQQKGHEPIMQLWRDSAQAAKIDPDAAGAFNETNVRRALAVPYNALASRLGEPTVQPTLPVDKDQYGNEYNPITHANVHEEAPEKVIVNGKGMNVPKGKSYGMEPWSQFGVGANVGQPAMEAWYQQYLASGKIPTGIPPGAKNAALSYITQRAGQDGVDATGLQVGATTRTQAAKATGGQVGKLAVASNELGPFSDQVLAASQEVPRGSWKTGTRISQWVGGEFNDPALLNFKAKMQTLENTYEQLAARSGMDAGKRAHIMDLFDTATSPAGVQRLTQALKEEAAGAKTGVQGAVREVSQLGRPSAPPPVPPRPGAPPARKVVQWGDLK